MSPSDVPNISDLDSEQLLALRAAIDVRLDEVRNTLTEQAQCLGLVVTNGKAKRKRRASAQKESEP